MCFFSVTSASLRFFYHSDATGFDMKADIRTLDYLRLLILEDLLCLRVFLI